MVESDKKPVAVVLQYRKRYELLQTAGTIPKFARKFTMLQYRKRYELLQRDDDGGDAYMAREVTIPQAV